MSFPLRPLIEALVDRFARHGGRGPAPRITLDVDPAHAVDAEPAVMERILQTLLQTACAAAICPPPPSDAPVIQEVVITSVQRPDGLEIEIADSGPAAPHALDITLASARSQLARVGCGLTVAGCPEGGRAVTVIVPRKAAQRMAA